MSRIMKRMIAIILLLMSAIVGLAGAQADGYSTRPEIHVNEAVMEVFVAMGFADILTIE